MTMRRVGAGRRKRLCIGTHDPSHRQTSGY
jgi:hypothetical protein